MNQTNDATELEDDHEIPQEEEDEDEENDNEDAETSPTKTPKSSKKPKSPKSEEAEHSYGHSEIDDAELGYTEVLGADGLVPSDIMEELLECEMPESYRWRCQRCTYTVLYR